MPPVDFCKKAACLFCCWCAFLPFSGFAGVMFQKYYVVKQDMGNHIWCEPYVVQKNDSLPRIFQEKGGIIDENPEEFLKIFKRLNPQVIDLENMRPGQQIYIPLKKMDPEAGTLKQLCHPSDGDHSRKEIAADFRSGPLGSHFHPSNGDHIGRENAASFRTGTAVRQ